MLPGQDLPQPPVNLHAMGTGNAKTKLDRLDNLVQWYLLVEVFDGLGGKAITLQPNHEGKIVLSPRLVATISDDLTRLRSSLPLQWNLRALWCVAAGNPLHPSTSMVNNQDQPTIHLRTQFVSAHGDP